MTLAKPRGVRKKKEVARQLYLSGEVSSNAEIAARLKVKPHTVGRWRKEEDWDGLRLKADKRAAEMFVEKIASDRTTLNVRHYRFWDALLAQAGETLKAKKVLDIRELERLAGIIDRAQKGQRLAKGMSVYGETEEAIRAQAEAEHRALVDSFIDAVKENVEDEEARERIRQAIVRQLPAEESDGAGEPQDAIHE